MKTYLVGGAVRDQRLNLLTKDRDYVVVGATPKTMITKGFKQVGRDFPVFIHPQSGEEYALARTERKSGPGYHGFTCTFDPSITLEDDLQRRDLTINAMAIDLETNNIIDPFNGQDDLSHKILRHVSLSFIDDPLRVLRVARFFARYKHLGFTIAPETLTLCQEMTHKDILQELTPARVWMETEKALCEKTPRAFFETLHDIGALNVIYPEIDTLWGVPQVPEYHPEIDCGIHTMLVLEQACLLSDDIEVRFAALTHDLGKASTPKNILPHHDGHEKRSVNHLKDLRQRYPIPNNVYEMSLLMAAFHSHVHQALQLKTSTLLDFMLQCDALRRPERFLKILIACLADHRGRPGFEDKPYPEKGYLEQCLHTLKAIDIKAIVQTCTHPQQLEHRIRDARLKALKELRV